MSATTTTKKRPTPPRSLKVLFIGNSFTARNDLPALVASLAKAAGLHLKHRLISVGGASLRTHWNKGHAQRAISTGKYDCVVLQEQSTLPVKNAQRMYDNVRLFDGWITGRGGGARTALYLTWSRKHEPNNQKRITAAYTTIAKELGATLIPAGVAWQMFRKQHAAPELYDKDGSHPTPAGSFLAACVAFQALLGRSPAGLKVEVAGLSAPEVALLERSAAAPASSEQERG
jgi:hypothetical protein